MLYRVLDPDSYIKFGWRWLIELTVGVGAILAVQTYFFPNDFGFLKMHPHPFWVVLLWMLLRFNFREIMTAIGILSTTYVILLRFNPEAFYYSTLSLVTDLKEPLFFFVIGGVISDVINRLRLRNYQLREQVKEAENHSGILEKKLITQESITTQLEHQLAWDPIHALKVSERLLELPKGLNKTNLKKLMNILIEETPIQDCTLYELKAKTFKAIHTISKEKTKPQVLNPEDDPIVMECIRSKEYAFVPEFSNPKLIEKLDTFSLVAAPLKSKSKVVYVISVQHMSFLDFTPHFLEFFKHITKSANSILNRA